MKTINLNRDTLILLNKIDKWLKDEYSNTHNEEVVLKTREYITTIMNRGYYNQQEQELLNELRSQYINDRKTS